MPGPGECSRHRPITPEVISPIRPSLYARDMSSTISKSSFGDVLRFWRTTRRLSQLALSADADVSQRHLSFLETGRAKPSREMVRHLGTILDLPLRAHNDMLLAAGFAPAYPETPIDAPAMEQVRHVLDIVLGAHEPFPAIVADRRWNIVLANAAAGRFIAALLGENSAAGGARQNLAKLVFEPGAVRAAIANWEEAGSMLLRRLEREVADRAGDTALSQLLDEVLAYPGVADLRRPQQRPRGSDLLVPVSYRAAEHDISMFSTIATIGAAYDVTLEELRLETFFPADAESEAVLRAMAV